MLCGLIGFAQRNLLVPIHFSWCNGTYVIFPIHLGIPIMKFLQEELEESNAIQRRICQMIDVQ